jgi:uncharacterized repeat protein (TIGR01451 family)
LSSIAKAPRIRKHHYKKFSKYLIVSVLVATLVLGLTKPDAAHAATTPSLGTAASYGILANTYTNSAAGTTVNGDVGFLVTPTVEPDPIGGHTNYGSSPPYAAAGADQSTALADLNAQACTFTWGAAVNLFLDTTHGPAGVYAPGVYCSDGAMSVGGSISLTGNGTHIFRVNGALGTTAGAVVSLAGGASACDVFWTPHATTFGAGSSFVGTLFDNDAVTVGAGTSILGRILAFNGPVTTATTTINLPTCIPPPGTLHVIKQVINNSGGSATAASFNLHVELSGTDVTGSPAAGAVSPGTPYSLSPNTYNVSEDANTAYTQSFSGDCDSSGNITLASGDDKTCTITNDDRPAVITVVKTVINDNGGTKIVSDFPLFVGGTPVTSGVANNFSAPASYAVTETTDSGYSPAFSGACDSSGNLSVIPGDSKTCTITNNDIAPTLHVIKTVINDNGGTAVASSATIHVKNGVSDVVGSPQAGASSPGTSYTLSANTYNVSENAFAGYSTTFSGACDSSGNVTLSVGDNKTCTITNNDIPASITVINVVINNDGRTKTVSDFPLFVSGTPVTSSVTNAFSAPASYAVTETIDPNYAQSFSGDCDSGGNLSLSPGDSKICTITNDDIAPIPPLISVVKVPSPLNLPAGPGLVIYTYTLHNIGTVPVTNVTMVDDSCSPVNLVSGDTNSNAVLEVSETWMYTCSTTLLATHTNIATATGWANGLTATDTASATVVVGIPLIPPLIHVTKIPNPLTLLAGGGIVTYTETVTNPGTVALSDVTLTDDKCSPVNYISGDTNSDSRLDPTETWIYTCQSNLTSTTTNTATASGEANSLTATDLATAIVIVAAATPATVTPIPTTPAADPVSLPVSAATPKFPNTGFAPDNANGSFWNFINQENQTCTYLKSY